MTTTDNFLNCWSLVDPVPPVPTEFRCYYDSDGNVTEYTMEQRAGSYIVVSQDEFFRAAMPARVVNNQLQIVTRLSYRPALVKSDSGTQCSKHDVCVIVNSDGNYWK